MTFISAIVFVAQCYCLRFVDSSCCVLFVGFLFLCIIFLGISIFGFVSQPFYAVTSSSGPSSNASSKALPVTSVAPEIDKTVNYDSTLDLNKFNFLETHRQNFAADPSADNDLRTESLRALVGFERHSLARQNAETNL